MPSGHVPSIIPAFDEFTCDQLIEILGKTLDLRDNETAGHSARVRRYCQEIAKVMGCSAEQLKQIARAASLHDMGKIAIPDAILLKSGKLSPQEWRVMETHVWVGFSLLRRIPFLTEVAQIVVSHHERYDGAGYPRALKGDAIPLGARVFAVADTLDAMTSDRPYRSALPVSAARQEILRESARQFDPKVVEAFLSIPETTLRQIMLEEKRRSARVPFQATVKCIGGTRNLVFKSLNISEGGLLLEGDGEVTLGEELEVEIGSPQLGQPLKVKAEAIRREMPNRTAIAFQALQPKDKAIIQDCLARLVQA